MLFCMHEHLQMSEKLPLSIWRTFKDMLGAHDDNGKHLTKKS